MDGKLLGPWTIHECDCEEYIGILVMVETNLNNDGFMLDGIESTLI